MARNVPHKWQGNLLQRRGRGHSLQGRHRNYSRIGRNEEHDDTRRQQCASVNYHLSMCQSDERNMRSWDMSSKNSGIVLPPPKANNHQFRIQSEPESQPVGHSSEGICSPAGGLEAELILTVLDTKTAYLRYWRCWWYRFRLGRCLQCYILLTILAPTTSTRADSGLIRCPFLLARSIEKSRLS